MLNQNVIKCSKITLKEPAGRLAISTVKFPQPPVVNFLALRILSDIVWWMGVDYELFCATLCGKKGWIFSSENVHRMFRG